MQKISIVVDVQGKIFNTWVDPNPNPNPNPNPSDLS